MSDLNGNEPMLRAVSDFVKKHVREGGQRIDLAGPVVQGPDMQPVADAIALAMDKMTEQVSAALAIEQPDVMLAVTPVVERIERSYTDLAERLEDVFRQQTKLIAQQAKLLADQSDSMAKLLKFLTEKKPDQLTLPERPKRKIVVQHGEDRSIITEE